LHFSEAYLVPTAVSKITLYEIIIENLKNRETMIHIEVQKIAVMLFYRHKLRFRYLWGGHDLGLVEQIQLRQIVFILTSDKKRCIKAKEVIK